MTAWRRAEERLWEQVEDRRWLGFWRLESRARKEWAELHKRQEETRQRLDRESRTLRGRLSIWRTEHSLRELVGAVRGREDLVEGWREDLDRYHKAERAALGKVHADSARQIERKVREAYLGGLHDVERHGPPTDIERAAREIKRRGRSKTRIPPRPPHPETPSVAGEGSSDDPGVLTHRQVDRLERLIQSSFGASTGSRIAQDRPPGSGDCRPQGPLKDHRHGPQVGTRREATKNRASNVRNAMTCLLRLRISSDFTSHENPKATTATASSHQTIVGTHP